MAMLPFCGYNMADYFAHWLAMGQRVPKPPKIFHVNWFRQDAAGKFLWPGFGENLRVLKWVVARSADRGRAEEQPIGLLPATSELDLTGLDVDAATMRALLDVPRAGWRRRAPA